MKHGPIDIEKLRVALRRMSRGNLLLVAERAIEIVPGAKLRQLVGDLVQLDDLGEGKRSAAPLLDEVRKFQSGAMHHEYYEDFDVDSKNFMSISKGTDAFIAEFDRLLGKCIHAADKGPRPVVREAFELLFALLRRIDEDPDSVVFFADEAGSWQIGVDWRVALPAYFRCLADGSLADDFAREVDRTITEFADHDRPRLLTAARRFASAAQKAALRRLPACDGRR